MKTVISRLRVNQQAETILMMGSVPRWVGIAYDQHERSADGAFYAADADVRETCASNRLSD